MSAKTAKITKTAITDKTAGNALTVKTSHCKEQIKLL